MKYIKNYKLFEGISEEEMNRILDKISELGIDSLSDRELDSLKQIRNGFKKDSDDVSFDKDGNLLVNGKPPIKGSDDVSFDKDGNLLVNDKPPLYKNVEDDKVKKVDKTDKVKKSNTNQEFCSEQYDKNNIYILEKNDKIVVALYKFIEGVNRNYFISFKQVKDPKSKSKCLKLSYNLNTSKFMNFNVFDNYNNKLDFNTLDVFLSQNGIDYETFNHGFYYIEENYNNR